MGIRELVTPLWTTRGASLAAITMLALALAASSAMMAVADAVLWRTLPYRAADELVVLATSTAAGEAQVSLPDFVAARAALPEAGLVAASRFTPELALSGFGPPRQLKGRILTQGYFATVGVRLAAGRDFSPAEEAPGAGTVTIITPSLRRALFTAESATDVVGRSLTLNGRPHTIVGVLPDFHDYLGTVDLYVPTQFPPTIPRRLRLFEPVGRLTGESLDRFNHRLLAATMATDDLDSAATRVVAAPLTTRTAAPFRQRLLLLMAAGLALLTVATLNFVTFLLARVRARSPEFSVRLALGARPSHIRALVFAEASMLCAAGAGLGLILTAVAVSVLPSSMALSVPHTLGVDQRLLAFVGVLTALVTVVSFGAASRRLPLSPQSTRTVAASFGAGRALVIGQLALSFALVVSAGVLARSYWTLRHVDPGFRIAERLTSRISLPTTEYPTPERRRLFWSTLLRELDSDGLAAAIATELPLTGQGNPTAFTARTANGATLQPQVRSISAGYFDLMSSPIVQGRNLTRQDTETSAPVVVVNQSLATLLEPTGSPIGQSLEFDFGGGAVPARVVGIVTDIHHDSLATAPRPEAYFSFSQIPLATYSLLVASGEQPADVAHRLETALARIDRDRPFAPVRTYGSHVAEQLSGAGAEAGWLMTFGVAALVVAATGLYSLLHLMVSASRREWVIRLAIGATPLDLQRLVVFRAVRDVAAGGGLGVLVLMMSDPLLRSRLHGISSFDALTLTATIGVLAAVTVLAALAPARSAAGIPPSEAFRSC